MFVRDGNLIVNSDNIEVVRVMPGRAEVVMASGREYCFGSEKLAKKLRNVGRGRLVRFLRWVVRA